jgi:large-conductance mechanosensitive channel
MIDRYLKSLGEFMGKRDAAAIGAAFLAALAIYSFLQTLVETMIEPMVAAIFDEPEVYALHFTISGNAFRYGTALVALILLALVFVLVAIVAKARRDPEGSSPRA